MHSSYITPPRPNLSELLIGPESFIDVLEDLHHGPGGIVVFGRKDPTARNGFSNIGGCGLAEIHQDQFALKKLLRIDGFFTINSVVRANDGRAVSTSKHNPILRNYRRRVDDLQMLNAAYVDVDCGKLRLDPAETLRKALNLLHLRGLPGPSLVSFSGTGLWMFWLFGESVPACTEAIDLLRRLNQQLVRTFEDFGADFSSTDAARITRCPGSINSKNGRVVDYFKVRESKKRTFKELLRIFQVPAQKTSLTAKADSTSQKNPKRVAAGKLRYSRRLTGFRRLCELRGSFSEGSRHQAIFGLAVLLFKNGLWRNLIISECVKFGLTCRPPVTEKAEITRRVDAAFRYRAHITDAKFAEWFQITQAEELQLPDWFRPKLEAAEPVKARIMRRREFVKREHASLDCGLSDYKSAEILANILKHKHGIAVSPMTVRRDMRALDLDGHTRSSNIFVLKESYAPPPFKERNVTHGRKLFRLVKGGKADPAAKQPRVKGHKFTRGRAV